MCLDQIRDGYFSPEDPRLFHDIYNSLVYHDRFMLCADFEDYIRAQDEVGELYKVITIDMHCETVFICIFILLG